MWRKDGVKKKKQEQTQVNHVAIIRIMSELWIGSEGQRSPSRLWSFYFTLSFLLWFIIFKEKNSFFSFSCLWNASFKNKLKWDTIQINCFIRIREVFLGEAIKAAIWDFSFPKISPKRDWRWASPACSRPAVWFTHLHSCWRLFLSTNISLKCSLAQLLLKPPSCTVSPTEPARGTGRCHWSCDWPHQSSACFSPSLKESDKLFLCFLFDRELVGCSSQPISWKNTWIYNHWRFLWSPRCWNPVTYWCFVDLSESESEQVSLFHFHVTLCNIHTDVSSVRTQRSPELVSLSFFVIVTDCSVRLCTSKNLNPLFTTWILSKLPVPLWNCWENSAKRKKQLLNCACRWQTHTHMRAHTLPLCMPQPLPTETESRDGGLDGPGYLAQYQISGVCPNAVDLRVFLAFGIVQTLQKVFILALITIRWIKEEQEQHWKQ